MMTEGPLTGVSVLDLTRVLSGPFCTMILRDLGAKIIKVEQPGKGDDSRAFGPFIDGESAYSSALNRGKESIALDLKNQSDKLIFEQLATKVDVLVENFRPGVMEKLGYTWPILRKLNPKLIYASISGFGGTGPDSIRACYDLVAQGISGVMSITGQKDDPPTKCGIELGDIGAGVYSVIGICSALYSRSQTGKGVRIGTSMLDCMVGMMVSAIANCSIDHVPIRPSGNRHRKIAPFDSFNTQDKPIVICAANDKLFAILADMLGHPEWGLDPLFASNDLRATHVEQLTALMESVLKTQSSNYWIEQCLAAGVPAAPINNLVEAMTEPQLVYRKMIAHFNENYMPDFRFPGNPIKFSAYPDTDSFPRGPRVDEHRSEILDWLKAAPECLKNAERHAKNDLNEGS